jgi:hypothetical protein
MHDAQYLYACAKFADMVYITKGQELPIAVLFFYEQQLSCMRSTEI